MRVLRRLLLVILLLLALYLIIQKSLTRVILDTAHAKAYALAVDTMNAAVQRGMSDGVAYEELIAVRTDAQGRVTMLQANTARMNELASSVALSAQEALAEDAAPRISVPLGAALRVPFLSALGPRIGVKLTPVGAVGVRFHTEFEAAGINQTRHKIYLQLHATVRLVLPTGAQPVTVDTQMLIAESIIVGEVPGSYMNVPESEMLDFGP
ncbi:MAG: sporulation protein YunB [Clostridia bacterium]|nr:sporulation protein YunB [Clostridia bacterium]